jgi:hypothetical protein
MLTCDSNILTCEGCLDYAPSIIPYGRNIFTLGIIWLMVQTFSLWELFGLWSKHFHFGNCLAYGPNMFAYGLGLDS